MTVAQTKPNRSPIVYFDMTEMLALKSKVIRFEEREREGEGEINGIKKL